MDSLPTSAEYDCIVVAAEIEAVSDTPAIAFSPGHYFEDLILHHYEEIQTADRLLKAAEDEYLPPQPLTPTAYYDNSLGYESDRESELVRLAEEEQENGLSGSLSPALYYESMKSASVNEPHMFQAYESIPGRQALHVEGSAPTSRTGDERKGIITKHLQESASKDVATTSCSSSSKTLITEDSTNVPSLSGENRDTFSRIVELVIDGKKAIVHEHLLCEISKFFERSSRQHTSQKPLSISVRDFSSDITWDTLLVFVEWVYFNRLSQLKEAPPNWDELLDLYFIADKWESVVLKNVLLDALIEDFRGRTTCGVFRCHYTKKIWSNTTPGASLRPLWIDFYRASISGHEFREEIKSDALDLDFLKELLVSLISSEGEDFNKESPPYANDPSIYHVADVVTGICCCRARFEGGQYTHKSQYEHEQARIIVPAGWRVYINSSEKNLESLQLELRAKEESLLDNKEEHKKWKSKAKEFEDQLAKLNDPKIDSEDHQDKMIEQMEKCLMTLWNLLDAFNISKDRDVLIVKTKVKALKEELQAQNKEVESQKHGIENTKKRKLDSDWRSGR